MKQEEMKLPHPELLNELMKWADDKGLDMKVQRVYNKALRAGKKQLCERIVEKYGHHLRMSDSGTTLWWALLAKTITT